MLHSLNPFFEKCTSLFVPLSPSPPFIFFARSHEEDSNAYVWSYAKRAIGTHVLRQKHWPGNAMMHPPDPNNFATSVAIRSVLIGCCCCCCRFWEWWQQRPGGDEGLSPTYSPVCVPYPSPNPIHP